MNPELQSAYRSGVRWSFIGSTGSALLQLVQMLVFARLAGPQAAGEYALAATFMSFLTPVAEAGLSQAVVQANALRPQQMATLGWINWLLGLLIVSILYLSGPWLAEYFSQPALPGLNLLMGASLLITPFGAQYAGVLTRQLRFEQSAVIELGGWVLSLLLTTVLALLHWGPWSIAWGYLARNIYGTLGCIWVGRRIMAYHPLQLAAWSDVKHLIGFGAYELGSRWADFLANYADKIIVGRWLGAAALGYYNLAFSFLMLPTARIGYVVTRVSFPIIARVRQDQAQLQYFFERAARQVILLLFPMYIALILFAEEIILLGFGSEWAPAIPLLQVFGLAGLVRSLCAPFPQVIKGMGKPQLWLIWTLMFGGACALALLLFLWYSPEVISAAWSRTVVKFVLELAMLFWLAARCGLHFRPVIGHALRVGAFLLPAIVISLSANHFISNMWILLCCKSAIYATNLLLLYLRFRQPPT